MVLSVENLFLLRTPLQLDLNQLAEGAVPHPNYDDALHVLLDAVTCTVEAEDQLQPVRTFLRVYLNNLELKQPGA